MNDGAAMSEETAHWQGLIQAGNEAYASKSYADAEVKFAEALAIAQRWTEPAQLEKLEKEQQDELYNRLGKSLNNMAALFHSQGKYAMAEELYNKCLDVKIKLHGEDSLEVAVNLHNLAALHSAKARWIMAEPLYKRSLDIRETILGHDHPELVSILMNYALMLRRSRRNEEAERLEQRAKKIQDQNATPTSV